jgi:hypothetical protein
MTTHWQEMEQGNLAAAKVYAGRQDKIMAAKAAFQETRPPVSEAPEETKVVFPVGLWRFMASVLLLILLLSAFSNGFSYHGFNREYVQEKLQEETGWQQVEQKVQTVYKKLLEQ